MTTEWPNHGLNSDKNFQTWYIYILFQRNRKMEWPSFWPFRPMWDGSL
ncbi:18737_t:CDS:2 [Gigaspora margarita]|uniref:18737_t:CDS:1 n=1 Tax=Gigaspora margarita TaxID=4874 RepID=A0ABN7V108_GIGMA|nr:18737_t:CDS:2 [Gigaspora margarita]